MSRKRRINIEEGRKQIGESKTSSARRACWAPEELLKTPTSPSQSQGGCKVVGQIYAIEPELIEVSDACIRCQELLTRESCAGLLQSIDAHGQQEPALVVLIDREGDGRYELISGSRRLWCVRELGRPLIAHIMTEELSMLQKLRLAHRSNIP